MLGVHGQQPLGLALDRSITSSPPTTRDSLFASARVLPDCRAASVGAESGRADERVQDQVGLGLTRRASRRRRGPTMSSTPLSAPSSRLDVGGRLLVGDRHDRRQELTDLPGEQLLVRARGGSPTTRNRSGWRRTTSRAWVPIDPVEPRMVSDLMRAQGTPSPATTGTRGDDREPLVQRR